MNPTKAKPHEGMIIITKENQVPKIVVSHVYIFSTTTEPGVENPYLGHQDFFDGVSHFESVYGEVDDEDPQTVNVFFDMNISNVFTDTTAGKMFCEMMLDTDDVQRMTGEMLFQEYVKTMLDLPGLKSDIELMCKNIAVALGKRIEQTWDEVRGSVEVANNPHTESTPKKRNMPACRDCGGSGSGKPTLSEPDGTPWGCEHCNGSGEEPHLITEVPTELGGRCVSCACGEMLLNPTPEQWETFIRDHMPLEEIVDSMSSEVGHVAGFTLMSSDEAFEAEESEATDLEGRLTEILGESLEEAHEDEDE